MALSVGQKENSLPFTLENCSFLNEAQQAVDEFRESLWEGVTTLKQNTEIPKSLIGRICYRPPKLHLGNPVVMKICRIWGLCTAALVNLKGREIHESLLLLLEERKINPVEFQATIPKLSHSSFLKVVRFMAAYGYLFEAIASVKENRPTMVRYNINKAVEWYHRAGIPQNDSSLINYQRVFLEHAVQLSAMNTHH